MISFLKILGLKEKKFSTALDNVFTKDVFQNTLKS